jgi:hypothetical protein
MSENDQRTQALERQVAGLCAKVAQQAEDLNRFGMWAGRRIASRIISEVPPVLAEFREKRWLLLWRRSTDDIQEQTFHRRYDGHANTITLIGDEQGFIFGGDTPVEWESRVHNGRWGINNNCYKGDDREQSFLFTLRNPHNIPPAKFPLIPSERRWAIYCNQNLGPVFGRDCELQINGRLNEGGITAGFGHAYKNDTGVNGAEFFAGQARFGVNEIEVFEITD